MQKTHQIRKEKSAKQYPLPPEKEMALNIVGAFFVIRKELSALSRNHYL